MEQGVVFRTASGQGYAYVTQTNQILTLNTQWLDSLDPEEAPRTVFQLLREAGQVTDTLPRRIAWPQTRQDYLRSLRGDLESVILEITQECTLRCEYCIYSGNYAGSRCHSHIHMTRETVKKALDLYRQHSGNRKKALVSLYGGEALVRFDVVRFAVAYAKEIFRDKDLSIRLATNGTTLTDPVIRWLEENPEVSVNVTLNGNSHDRYRKFPDGTGSLACVLEKLRSIRDAHPALWDRVNFLANIVTVQELLDLRQFYREQVGKPPVMVTGIIAQGGNDVIQRILREQHEEAAKRMAEELYCRTLDEYLKPYYHDGVMTVCTRPLGQRPEVCENRTCCMPFTECLFISAEGKLGICERVNMFDGCGDIHSGIDLDCAQRLLDSGEKFFSEHCTGCWCQRLCDVCFKDFTIHSDGTLELPPSVCEGMKRHALESLRLFCRLGEENPEAIEALRAQWLENLENREEK